MKMLVKILTVVLLVAVICLTISDHYFIFLIPFAVVAFALTFREEQIAKICEKVGRFVRRSYQEFADFHKNLDSETKKDPFVSHSNPFDPFGFP